MNAKLHVSKNTWVDPDDAPELDDTFFTRAELHQGNKLIRRGRPVKTAAKIPVSVRYSPEVINEFKASGAGWQTRMDAALKEWLKQHKPSDIKI